MISCFTLGEKLTKGIDADSFDCIMSDTDTRHITYADIHTVPVRNIKSKDLRKAAQESLVFLQAAKGDENIDSGILLAVRADIWILAKETTGIALLDPGGTHSMVLLYIPQSSKHVLASTVQHNLVLSVDASSTPKLETVKKSSLLWDALNPTE